jgi:hypothetical protein
VEALQQLVDLDNGPQGPASDFHYVEFDVHVSGEGAAPRLATALLRSSCAVACRRRCACACCVLQLCW